MSLSRYYKNPPSFQAETLVKQSEKTASGWNPDPRKDQQPFQALPNALSSLTRHDSSKNTPHSPAPPSDTQETGSIQAPGPTSSASAAINNESAGDNEVDLSMYIDRATAENTAAEAYRQGLEMGREKAEQDFGYTARALFLACQQMDNLRATIINNSSEELLDFALTISERILRLSIREQDHTIVATVEEALRRAVKSDEFTIYIHPSDYDILAAKSAEIVAGLSGLNNIVLRKDPGIERGGARIESDNCTIDATIAGQFELIRDELKNKT